MFQLLGRIASSRIVSIGAGVAIGVAAAPYLKKLAENFKPEMDEALDNLVGKAESVFENTSDMIAKAKEKLDNQEDDHQGCSHDHGEPDEEVTKTH